MKILQSLLLAILFCAASLLANTSLAETKTVIFTLPEPVPKSITIEPGDSIQFQGVSSFHPIRQVTNGTGDVPVSGGFASQSGPFTVQFDNEGTFFYQCENHGTNGGSMRGSVTVQAGSGSNPTPTPTEGPEPTPRPTVAPPAGCSAKPSPVALTSPALGAQINKTRVTLDWEDDSCATSYKVQVKEGKKKGPTADQKTVTNSNYKTKKLSKKKTYFWNVKPCNSLGCSNSATRSFSIP